MYCSRCRFSYTYIGHLAIRGQSARHYGGRALMELSGLKGFTRMMGLLLRKFPAIWDQIRYRHFEPQRAEFQRSGEMRRRLRMALARRPTRRLQRERQSKQISDTRQNYASRTYVISWEAALHFELDALSTKDTR